MIPDSVEVAWKCRECGIVHKDEDAAIDCCPREISSGYLCPECESFYMKKSDAIECCEHDHEAESQANPTELEAAGQQRFAL